MMARLNQAYVGTGFTFVYEGGTETADGDIGAFNQCNQFNNWPFLAKVRKGGDDALNIVICDTCHNKTSTFQGVTTFPTDLLLGNTDGMILAHPDSSSLLDTQESLVHESGHFLGLLHTFAGPGEFGKNVSHLIAAN
jgi:hypothetical protein